MREKKGGEGGGMRSGGVDWEAVAKRYHTRLFRIAYLMTGSRQEAEDATQQTFLKGIHRARAFRGDSQVYTWLYRILVNQCIDQIKRRTRERSEPDGKPVPGGGRTPWQERALLEAETHDAVRREVDMLEPRHRAVIVLRHFEGLSYLEMSRVLRCPVGTVRSRLANAREILRARLSTEAGRANGGAS